jgi:hypothetical protein
LRKGLLWYDDSDLEFSVKVLEAAERYEEKFGIRPNRCYVNPRCLVKEELPLNGIRVLTSAAMLPHHFWVGVGSDPDEESA